MAKVKYIYFEQVGRTNTEATLALGACQDRFLEVETQEERGALAMEDGPLFREYALFLAEGSEALGALAGANSGKARSLAEGMGWASAALGWRSLKEQEAYRHAQVEVRRAESSLGECSDSPLYAREDLGLEREREKVKGFAVAQGSRMAARQGLWEARRRQRELAERLELEPPHLEEGQLERTLLHAGVAVVELLLEEEKTVALVWEGGRRARAVELPRLSGRRLGDFVGDLPSPVKRWVDPTTTGGTTDRPGKMPWRRCRRRTGTSGQAGTS